MRHMLLALAMAMLLGPAAEASAQVSVNIGFPGVHIDLDVPSYPHLVRVPGYPVYYDSRGSANYFFYDGLYWVYWGDSWYSSPWYNGPWDQVDPEYVPYFVLRVPVRYYRQPPVYFRGWRADAPPRWGDHWGRTWESRRSGWDRWDRRSAPAPAPLPVYQRQYSGDRYPRTAEQERQIRTQNYRYQPREAVSQQRLGVAPAPPVTRDASRALQPRESRPEPQQVRESRPAPQVRENRPAPQQVRESPPAPQAREVRPAPEQARESRQAPQQVRENRPAPQVHDQGQPQGRGQGNKEKDKDKGNGKDKDKDKGRGHDRSDR